MVYLIQVHRFYKRAHSHYISGDHRQQRVLGYLRSKKLESKALIYALQLASHRNLDRYLYCQPPNFA